MGGRPCGEVSLGGGGKRWGRQTQRHRQREVNLQFCIASNELVTPNILVCPSDPQRRAATNFPACSATNVSYALGDDADQKKPNNPLAADRSLTGFEYSGLHDNTACYTINKPGGGATRSGTGHSAMESMRATLLPGMGAFTGSTILRCSLLS
jgi:hypothetical protein